MAIVANKYIKITLFGKKTPQRPFLAIFSKITILPKMAILGVLGGDPPRGAPGGQSGFPGGTQKPPRQVCYRTPPPETNRILNWFKTSPRAPPAPPPPSALCALPPKRGFFRNFGEK